MGATMPLTIGFSPGAPRQAPGKASARPDVPVARGTSATERRAQAATAIDITRTNDTAVAHDAVAANDITAWIRHAEAANGFGGDAAPAGPLSYRLQQSARASRSSHVGGLIVGALAKVVAAVREAVGAYRRHREARVMRTGLQELDDRTLRDIGFTRSEIDSVIAEATGHAEWTRLRTRWLHGQP